MRRLAELGPYLLIGVAFVAVRLAAHAWGLRFHGEGSWHFIEPDLLEQRFLESLWYLHAQPPGFNALLGLVQKLAGASLPIVFAWGYRVCGLALGVVTYRLATELGAARWPAALVATLLVVSPPALLY